MDKKIIVLVLTVLVQTTFAQFGAGGFVSSSGSGAVADITTPLDSTGIGKLPIAWYDFSDASSLFQDAARTVAVSANDDPVRGVTDKSGNTNHLNVNVANGERPLYKTNIQNSKACVLWDGVDDYLQRATWAGGAVAQPVSIFIVCKVVGAGNVKYLFDGGNAAFGVATYVDGQLNYFTTGVSSYIFNPYPNPTFQVQQYQFAKTDSTYVRINGRTMGVGSNGHGTNSLNGITLGSFNGAALFTNMYICEVVVYSGYFSVAQSERVFRYLNTRWACF